jgi:hypothetical protein
MSHLTQEQWYTISLMKDQGYNPKDISIAIGKDISVVSRGSEEAAISVVVDIN